MMKKLMLTAAAIAIMGGANLLAHPGYEKHGASAQTQRELECSDTRVNIFDLRKAVDAELRASQSDAPQRVDYTVNLPLELTPEEEDFRLFNVIDHNNDGKKWVYNKNYKGFVSPNNKDKDCDDWLIFPAINFDSSKTYELSFTLGATMRGEVFSGSFEVYVGPNNTVEGMEKFGKRIDYFSTSGRTDQHDGPFVTQFGIKGQSGTRYVAIRCITEKNIEVVDPESYTGKKTVHESWPIGVYDIKVYATSGNAEAAAQPDFTLTPADNGALKATVEFTMPHKTLNGQTLPASTQLKANITTPAETKVVSGTPGSIQKVEIATIQGVNEVKLRVDTEVEGTPQSKEVYTGVYTPNRVHDLTGVLSRDNMSLSMTWTAPTSAKNDGYFDPELVTYGVYKYDSEKNEYILIKDLGKVFEYTYTLPEGSVQRNEKIYIIPSNAAGMSDDLINWIDEDAVSLTEVMGTPYKLPLEERFDNQALSYTPMLNERPGDYRGRVMISDPSGWVPDGNGAALIAYNPSDEDATWARVSTPKISTKGVTNAAISFALMRYAGYTSTVKLYAQNYDSTDVELIQSFDMSASGDNTWVDYSIPLPDKFQNNEWVRFYFDFNLPEVDYVGGVDYYAVRHSADNDLAVVNLYGDKGVAVGNQASFTAEVYNVGMHDAIPTAKFEILSEGEVTASADVQGDKLESGKRSLLSWNYTPQADMYGKPASVRITLTGADDVTDNNTRTTEFTIRPAETPIVMDLKAMNTEGGIALNWSEPMRANFLTESFEHVEGWSYGEDIANFANIDRDKHSVYKFSNNQMPNEQVAKAFMVAVPAQMQTSEGLEAHTGAQYLLATCPEMLADGQTPPAADDWLISPLTIGNQFVSFWMNIINERYPETIRIMTSNTGREPSDFQNQVQVITKDKIGWQKFEVQLPEAAKYFAIHYKSQDMFGILIDDIRFADAEDLLSIDKYEVYRDGEKIGESTTPGYLDSNVKDGETHVYRVAAVGDKTYPQSNTSKVLVDSTGIDSVSSAASVSSGHGVININGFADQPVSIADTAGRVVYSGTADSNHFTIQTQPGIYIVSVARGVHKVVVR